MRGCILHMRMVVLLHLVEGHVCLVAENVCLVEENVHLVEGHVCLVEENVYLVEALVHDTHHDLWCSRECMNSSEPSVF